ncbi:MAG TPA: nucleotidyl transferase AbiEii/AbiGii toxin family protein [Polyangiaceae bacterium]|nr:nucleotidyl transferase AbiEii/AbiGii toxin family protein [Polyangiaceae bacterium]
MVARKDTLRTEELSALRQVRGALPEADILLVGAVAIDRHIALARQTDDMDLAIGIELEDFPGPLGSIHGWRHDQARAEHRFFTECGLQLDIIPAGASIRERGMIRWPSGFEMSLVGFDVAFRRADRVDLEGVRVLCPALPELLLLKIAAWLDRRHERQKDLGDIAVLLRNYLEDDHERHWHDEIQAGALDHDLQGAYALGLDLRRICEARHIKLVHEFCSTAPANLGAHVWIDQDEPDARRFLDAFRAGFDGIVATVSFSRE